uniref:Potassium channel domain-containing protein n=1 Tax=Plectus sambesii TaxID=2011161 RepID=A0A914WE86_9BILA
MAVNLAMSTDQLPELEPDVELSLLWTSSLNLIEDDPITSVECGTSVPSVHSVRTARKVVLRGVRRTRTLIKNILSDFKLFIVIMLYSVMGAGLFMWIEIPSNLSHKQEALEFHLTARDTLLFRLRMIYEHDGEDRENRWKEAILDYENKIGIQEPITETDWTFWMSFLYAGTIFTTIGYGNITCKTTTGQVVTVCYAIVGIPLMLIVLNNLRRVLLKFIQTISDYIGDIILYIGLRLGIYKFDPSKPPHFRMPAVSRRAVSLGVFSASMDPYEYISPNSTKATEKDIEANPPVVGAIIFTIGWLFLCFGDVSPAHPEYMFMTFGVVLIGLALVSVCINVVQEKLSQLYMGVLEKLMEDYSKAAEQGDQTTAVKRMMARFKDQAKFLMPLMSKSQGAKVMAQFKDKAKAQGIELPPVLTNLDPETGMPAFAKAKAEDFEQYIEKANEQAKPPEIKMVEVQTDAFEPPPPPPVEKPRMTTSFTQYHLSTASVQSETTDLIRMVNAQAEAKIYADSAESSTQVELDHLEAGVQVFIDVRPQSIDAETETQISYSDIDCQTPSELVSPSKSVTTSEQACQSSVSGEDFSQQTNPDVQHNVAQTIATESRERQMQTVPEVEQVIPLQSAPPQCSEIETQTEAFTRAEASHQTEWGSADFAVQASLGDEPKDTAEFGAQFEPPPLETLNSGVQASPDLSETQSQTSETPSNDSGIQTWISMDDTSTQAGAESEHCESQTAFSFFAPQNNFSQHEEEVVSVEVQSHFSMFNCTSSDAQSDSLTFLMQDASTQQTIVLPELKSTSSQATLIICTEMDSQTEPPPETVESG